MLRFKQYLIENNNSDDTDIKIADYSFSPMDAFINDNADRMEETGHTIGNQNTVILTFNDEEIYEQFKTLIVDDMKNDYKQYCDDNNITIDAVTEDI